MERSTALSWVYGEASGEAEHIFRCRESACTQPEPNPSAPSFHNFFFKNHGELILNTYSSSTHTLQRHIKELGRRLIGLKT